MARLLYKPFGIVLSIVAVKIAGRIFHVVWKTVDKDAPDGVPPRATEASAPLGKAIAATAVEAATYAGTKAAFDRFGVRAFYYLTGFWAGSKERGKI